MKSITEYINEALAPASSPEYWENSVMEKMMIQYLK